ncbi:toll IL1-receptor protein [Brazilian porcupinepox virus 1]|nr:toll IL1-receptor protein [Brazilian porcupinepox virus 1]
MSNLIRLDVNVKDNNINISVYNSNSPVLVRLAQPNIISKNNYIYREVIFEDDDMYKILYNYIWYRGFIGLDKNHGRLFKELIKFDDVSNIKYGNVQNIFKMLDLNSKNGIENFIKFINLQESIFKEMNETESIAIIGLCAMVSEEWKKNKQCLNWSSVVDILFKILDPDVVNGLKYTLYDRMLYE